MAKNSNGQFVPEGVGSITFEHIVTKLMRELDESSSSIDTSGKSVDNKINTVNNTLTNILSEVQKTKDFEVILVRCQHTAQTPVTTDIYKEITSIESGQVVRRYYSADGTQYTPVTGDVFTYIDTSTILTNIYQQIQLIKKPSTKILETLEQSTAGSYTLPNSYSGSIHNSGTGNITFGNITLLPGMTASWGYDGSDDLISGLSYNVSQNGIASIAYLTTTQS